MLANIHPILGALLGTKVPILGTIFTIIISGKYLKENKADIKILAVVSAITLAVTYFAGLATRLDVLTGLMSVTLFYPVYFAIMKKQDFRFALYAQYGVTIIVLLVFHNYIRTTILNGINELFDVLMETDPEALPANFEDTRNLMEKLVTNYLVPSLGVNVLFMMYLGSRIAVKMGIIVWDHLNFRNDYNLIYLLIAAIVLFLVQPTRIIGSNFAIIVLALYFLQGISVLEFRWQKLLQSSVLAKVIFILILFSPYTWIIISLIGIFDTWLNSRKLVTRRKNGNNLNE